MPPDWPKLVFAAAKGVLRKTELHRNAQLFSERADVNTVLDDSYEHGV